MEVATADNNVATRRGNYLRAPPLIRPTTLTAAENERRFLSRRRERGRGKREGLGGEGGEREERERKMAAKLTAIKAEEAVAIRAAKKE